MAHDSLCITSQSSGGLKRPKTIHKTRRKTGLFPDEMVTLYLMKW